MQTLDELRRRIDIADDMESVVSSMKVLAVVGIRQFEKALGSLSDYSRAVELGLQAILMSGDGIAARLRAGAAGTVSPPAIRTRTAASPRQKSSGRARAREGRRAAPAQAGAAIVFGSEQGLSGQFNEQLAGFALERIAQEEERYGPGPVLAVGDHAAYRLKAAGLAVERIFPLQGTARAVTAAARQILIYLDHQRRVGRIGRAVLYYHRPLSGANYRPHARELFPVPESYLTALARRPWPSRSRPMILMNRERLFRALLEHRLRLTLERAFVESLLSESASRLLAMQVAEKNIAEYIEDLRHQFNNRRQAEITAELLDIVAGSEAMSPGMF